jgi:hypothetical protein
MSTPTTDEDGTKWYRNEQGQLHRIDGPAMEGADGSKAWYLNGQRHRTDGSAIEWADGYKSWWVNGQPHRPDGPAVEWADGSKAWWVNGQRLTEEEFNARYGQQQPSLDGSIITINGITYKLVKQ